MIDTHCHILPYVDDGAQNMENALELLEVEAQQGVTEVCLTPHFRSGMFTSSDEKIQAQFERLKQNAAAEKIPVKLHLSREYYYNSDFQEILQQNKVLPMGSRNVILVEFRYSTPFASLVEASGFIRQLGYRPMFAHVERYECIQEQPALAQDLINMGTMIQLNADGILGLEGRKQKKTCLWLLKNHCVFVVASDAHDTQYRAPHLEKCAAYLDRKFGRERSVQLLHSNPLFLL